MEALVVYESMYGDTRAIATEVAAGLGGTHEVTLVPVARATPARKRIAQHPSGRTVLAAVDGILEMRAERAAALDLDELQGILGWARRQIHVGRSVDFAECVPRSA